MKEPLYSVFTKDSSLAIPREMDICSPMMDHVVLKTTPISSRGLVQGLGNHCASQTRMSRTAKLAEEKSISSFYTVQLFPALDEGILKVSLVDKAELCDCDRFCADLQL